MDIETLKATLTEGFEGLRKEVSKGYLNCTYHIAISEGKTKAEAIQIATDKLTKLLFEIHNAKYR
jgi:hypothetical protein